MFQTAGMTFETKVKAKKTTFYVAFNVSADI